MSLFSTLSRFRPSLVWLALSFAGCSADVAPFAEADGAGLYEREANPTCLARSTAAMPARLSELGCFAQGDLRSLAPGVIPFDVNAPLWTDDADKERWFAIPDGSAITVDARGDFSMPPGSVMGKTFSLQQRRIETRILMRDPTDGFHGYSYRWNAEQTDATLVPEAGELVAMDSSAQPWTIPSRSDCAQCHDAKSNYNLGLEVAQLDRAFVYPSTGLAANQLDTLHALGLFEAPLPASPQPDRKLVDYRDEAQPLAARARSYLHANCASCHVSSEGACTGDLRWDASDSAMGVCNVEPKFLQTTWGWPGSTMLLAPGAPERSAIVQRMRASGGSLTAMPPLGRHGVHEAGVQLIERWIREMPGCAP